MPSCLPLAEMLYFCLLGGVAYFSVPKPDSFLDSLVVQAAVRLSGQADMALRAGNFCGCVLESEFRRIKNDRDRVSHI